ncbi:type I site-specific deoxyribonuclease, HsdR family protein [Burkholderia pseudomallei]|uniref:type I restriction endonuclease subunit R n=1 Tax=Burkholderia pseudomallei TaxID=28450 RepID=UPI000F08F9F1|nr:HsdR family type I site-specific deoxyribonuclease [Burkholderia pseudomallei]MCW0166791.1 HsdR family type I site-specific deoxyribonuclease [Burkholderia pseudomallei]CAJ3059209.1 HsdR family type I site-specific deoxyribonuclease [Burkholderia pseudomallei]CAJ3171323.1 type I site-specific deoxyribonuclease, HsdR family protein [Burkholderia pseudomallei]CAJ4831354.1 type I site-specific deoxyribonuclease, HsdR family protein [Burkholderia pseudomallei]CAJ5973318.1 type I site-specific d
MSTLKISEAGTVQFPMVKHAVEIGWTPIPPEDARIKRGGEDGAFFRDVLEAKISAFNSWLTADAVRSIVETLDALPASIEGNRELLSWLRGERQWYDEAEKRHRAVTLIDFENVADNAFHVTWEWKIKPPARKGNRADVMFLVNGVPVVIVEHKNPKDGDGIERAIKQLRRYELETPELLATPQLFNVTHLIDYWYGVTWNANRRDMARWKQAPEESYRFAVQAFFERHDFLRTLQHWILFYVQDGETRKSVLRQHQRRAIDAILDRCADPAKTRGLVWHTQGSGKTFTLLTAARLILENKPRFANATVILVVDRTELEGQLKGWVERLLGEMQQEDIAVARAKNKAELQSLLDADFRGLIISMIHKFEAIRKDSCLRDNVYVFIDEAHRSVAKDLGTYMMAAVPKATIIGFTGTPIDRTSQGEGTFKIFGAQDEQGYLDKYSIAESIADETTLPIKHVMAPSEMTVPVEQLDKEFFALAESEGVTDVEELNKVLDRAVGLRTFLTADDRIEKVAAFVAEHFKENVLPLGYKAFVVAVNREACAKYKKALDKLLPPEWTAPVYTQNAADAVDRPLVAKLQLSDEQEEQVRLLFKKPAENPKILIVTDKLLTGYDAPPLYCLYLDKPMRDHVLLQSIARVNRPYVDANGVQKRVGLVVDFVGVLRELKKALKFDSDDVSGVIEDLDVLLVDFQQKISRAEKDYLDADEGGGADERLERLVYGRFLAPEARKAFFEAYKEIETLWEILSPSPELRDHIASYKQLSQLYAAVRNAYAEKVGFVADLAYKTRRLIESSATQKGLGRLTKSVTFDVQTLDSLRGEKGSDEGKVFNLVRGLQQEIDENPATAPVLQPLKDRAERILKDLEERKTTGLAAMDMLAALATEKETALKAARDSGLSPRAFAVYWVLRSEAYLPQAGLDPMDIAREAENLLARFPNAAANTDELRRFRASLYKPLLALSQEDRARAVDLIVKLILKEENN